ncbi:MAG: hypothetical protein IPI67_16120 [Myxococcales bacterium]|nr:hypothetical protein [Myxococcales bacterium]
MKLPVFVVAASLALPWSLARAESATEARLSCRREAVPGRVLCEVEVEVPRGRLAWADVLVTRTPDFARTLKARIGPRSASGGTPRRLRLPLALAATRTGSGEVVATARWVMCVPRTFGGELCSPQTRSITTRVEVGATESARP